jgi:hypothetical protein
MATLTTKLMIYDPHVRTERGYHVTVEGPDLIIDALDRDTSCLDMQILAEAAASARSGMFVLTVKAEKQKRG